MAEWQVLWTQWWSCSITGNFLVSWSTTWRNLDNGIWQYITHPTQMWSWTIGKDLRKILFSWASEKNINKQENAYNWMIYVVSITDQDYLESMNDIGDVTDRKKWKSVLQWNARIFKMCASLICVPHWSWLSVITETNLLL